MKNSDWTKWSAIAEILASIAVVVTLIVLVIGVRENTDVVRASAYERNLQTLVDWRLAILQDADAVRVFSTHFIDNDTDRSRFTSEDQGRLQLILGAQWVAYEKSYFAHEYGLLGEAEWERFTANLCRNYGSGETYWNQVIRQFLTEEFVTYVVDVCSGN